MENKLSEKQFQRLDRSIDWSMQQLEKPRNKRVEAIRDLVGAHYGSGDKNKIMPVNSMKLAVDVYVRHLVARNPRGMFSTKDVNLRPTCKNFELAVNQIPEEINLSRTLREAVTEALFAIGVVKCGLHETSSIMGKAYGESFVDCITMDDYFCDMSAKRWDLIQYEGNDYWMDYEDFKDTGWDNIKDVKADEYQLLGTHGEVPAGSITSDSTAETYLDKIHLRDIWLPKERKMITYGVTSKKRFNETLWDDDAPSPYIRLGFTWVPGNLLPLPPVASWRDLNELNNSLFRKLGDSADSFKEVQGFPGTDAAQVDAFKNARHGSGINYTGPKPEKLTAGGVDARTLAFQQVVKELQSYYMGSLDSLGGLAPMSATIGQDKLLAEAASSQVRDMADQTVDFVRTIFKALAYYEWNNPVGSRQIQKPIADGISETLSAEWNQETRQGTLKDYDISIDVYSLQDDSPALQLQKLGAFVQQYILPFAGPIAERGGYIDVEAIIKKAAELANLHEATSFVNFPDDPIPSQGGPNQMNYNGAPKLPQDGSPQGVGQQGQSSDLMQQLMSMPNT